MNQIATGQYIARKRKEKNLTQAQLAERLGVSNKTISKWENGKCMPDYSVIEPLCRELEITVAELMDGENGDGSSIRAYDETQIVELLRRTQELEKKNHMTLAMLLVTMGIAMLAVSQMVGGSPFRDFVAGFGTGLAIVEMVVGIFWTGRSLAKS